MSNQLVHASADPDAHGWRAGTTRVIANALLVLLAFEAVSMVAAAAEMIVAGVPTPATPVEGMPLLVVVAGFLLVRWLYVLPGLLVVLVGLESAARRVPHARALTAIVALAPMALWELWLKSPGGFPSEQGAILGVTAVLFAVLARLPAADLRHSAGRALRGGGIGA